MTRRIFSVAASCLMLMVATAQSPRQPKPDVAAFSSQSWTDVDYVGDGIVGHKLDIYMPKSQSKPKVIITIYGSAWFANNAKGACMDNIGKALLEAGYAVATINHRSSSDAKWPAQIQDVKAAIRYVRANAKTYGYDASFIGITGFSSGGHLSTCAATTNGVIEEEYGGLKLNFEGSLGNFTSTSSKVDACVDWFGPVDFINVSDWKGHGGNQAPEYAMIDTSKPEMIQTWLWLMSPVNFVEKGNDPEILIIHGDDDHVVGNAQSHHLKKAYDTNHVPCTLIDVPGGDHGPGCFEPKYYMQMIKYFDRMSGTKRSADFRLSTPGSKMVSPSTREESAPQRTEQLEEVLTINIDIDQQKIANVRAANRSVNMIPFGGTAESKYFTGRVLTGGVDTQQFTHKQGQQAPEGTLSARYMLEGKDKDGNDCKIFIENNGKFGEEFTHPTIITDSRALGFLNNVPLKGKLDMSNQKLTIRIFCSKFEAKMERVKPIPAALREPVSQKGTVETFNYTVRRDGKTLQKHARVYLPYGYKQGKKKYNVVYLMHGGGDNSTSFFSPERSPIPVTQVVDYLVAQKMMEPVIVVTPTFYDNDEKIGNNRMEDAIAECRDFHKELANDLIPAIEKKYKAQKGREHRAFGGFSMGSLCTWYQLAYGNKDVKYYLPLSGDLWVYEDGKKQNAATAARWLNDILMKSPTGKDVEVFAYTGDKDMAGTPQKNLIEALSTEAPVFRYQKENANLHFAMKTGGEHWYGDINEYIYYALPLLWK